MKEIQLTQGKVTRVDDADFAALNMFNWSADVGKHTVYAVRATRKGGKYKRIRMHNAISGIPRTDHEDGDGLNNQRYNLRPATRRQNNMNTAKAKSFKGKPTSSKYKGVSRHEDKWKAQIFGEGKYIHLGVFAADQEIDAAKAYDVAAVHYFGEFARLNFPVDNVAGL